MDRSQIFMLIEFLGVIAFSASGAMVAIGKHMDILGVIVLGVTTAVGGGIVRDLILGITPPAAFQNPIYALLAIAVAVIVFLPPVRSHVNTDKSFLLMFDAIGLGIFTAIGTRAGAETGNEFLMIFLGALTGVGGGVLRDIFAGDIPMIFVRHFYACASLIGACCYVLMINFADETMTMIVTALIVVVLRLLAAKYKWHLPKA